MPSHDVAEIRARESHAHNGLTATTRHDNVHEMEPLTDVVRNLQQSMSQVSSGLLQTAQTWANAGVCGGLCACAVVHSIKRLVSLMLLKWFLSDSFIYFMYRMFNENFY